MSSIDWATEAARINNEPGDFAATPLSLAFDPGASTSFNPLRNNYQAKRYPGTIYNAVDQAVTNNNLLQTNVDATGRFGQTQFFASASFLDQQGALRFTEGFQRYTARVNVDQSDRFSSGRWRCGRTSRGPTRTTIPRISSG